jgi:hypothetical protein
MPTGPLPLLVLVVEVDAVEVALLVRNAVVTDATNLVVNADVVVAVEVIQVAALFVKHII